MKNINKFYTALITMTFGFSLISNASAEDKKFLADQDKIEPSETLETQANQ